MKILGHGIDIVQVDELEAWPEELLQAWIARSFTPDEISEAPRSDVNWIERLAGRFAAKEAVLKALGTGFGGGVAFSDVIISREPGAPPRVTLTGGAKQAATSQGINNWFLSISHSAKVAIASAVATD